MRGRRAGRVASSTALAIGIPAGVATVAGFAGSWWWPFDLAASFRPHYVLVLVIAAALAELRARRRVVAGLFLAGALLNVAVVAPFFAGSPRPAEESLPAIRLITFNVTASNPDRAAVLRWLDAQQADVIVLQEWSSDWTDTFERFGSRYDLMAEPPGDRTFGPAMLVDPAVSVRSVEVLRPGEVGDPVIRAVIERGGAPVTILGAHPRAPRSAASAGARDDLIGELARLAAATGTPVVVAGDLNATAWSHSVRSLQTTADLENSLHGFGIQPTWPASFPPVAIAIDHVLYSAELTVVSRSTGPSLGSSHRPVTVTIGFAARPGG